MKENTKLKVSTKLILGLGSLVASFFVSRFFVSNDDSQSYSLSHQQHTTTQPGQPTSGSEPGAIYHLSSDKPK